MFNNWLDVNDEVPAHYHIPVLVWTKDGCTVGYFERKRVFKAFSREKEEETIERWYSVYDDILNDVIAWQPLPFGPNGEASVHSNLIRAKQE